MASDVLLTLSTCGRTAWNAEEERPGGLFAREPPCGEWISGDGLRSTWDPRSWSPCPRDLNKRPYKQGGDKGRGDDLPRGKNAKTFTIWQRGTVRLVSLSSPLFPLSSSLSRSLSLSLSLSLSHNHVAIPEAFLRDFPVAAAEEGGPTRPSTCSSLIIFLARFNSPLSLPGDNGARRARVSKSTSRSNRAPKVEKRVRRFTSLRRVRPPGLPPRALFESGLFKCSQVWLLPLPCAEPMCCFISSARLRCSRARESDAREASFLCRCA